MGTILTRCEEHGVRMTNQRRVIASVLEQADDHPDVEELYARVSRGKTVPFQSQPFIAP